MANDLQQLRIVRRAEVLHLTGLSRASLYRLIGQKEFPAPVRLTGGNAVGWRAGDIRAWLQSREPVGVGAVSTSDDSRRGGAE